MSKTIVEWKRQFVTKQSEITNMKNGVRKEYFYDNKCRHNKTIMGLKCPICKSSFECCQKCYLDFCEDGIEVNGWDDLICPDCLEQCQQCKKFTCEAGGSRSDSYPFNLYCATCAKKLGICYDSPDELIKKKHQKSDSDDEYPDEVEVEDEDEETTSDGTSDGTSEDDD
jgi:hypothetical protein